MTSQPERAELEALSKNSAAVFLTRLNQSRKKVLRSAPTTTVILFRVVSSKDAVPVPDLNDERQAKELLDRVLADTPFFVEKVELTNGPVRSRKGAELYVSVQALVTCRYEKPAK